MRRTSTYASFAFVLGGLIAVIGLLATPTDVWASRGGSDSGDTTGRAVPVAAVNPTVVHTGQDSEVPRDEITLGTDDDFGDDPVDEPVDPCDMDLSSDGMIGVNDVILVFTDWGPCDGCPTDLNGDGQVDVFDLIQVILYWGACADP